MACCCAVSSARIKADDDKPAASALTYSDVAAESNIAMVCYDCSVCILFCQFPEYSDRGT